MSVYPMRVIRRYSKHRGGTKEYHFTKVINAKGMTMLVFRWNGVGKKGQKSVEIHTSSAEATRVFDDKIKAKEGNGYVHKNTLDEVAHDEADLKKFIGPSIWPEISPDELRALDPDIDTKGAKHVDPVDFEKRKDGSFKPIHTPKIVEPDPEVEKEKSLKKAQENPLWGMF